MSSLLEVEQRKLSNRHKFSDTIDQEVQRRPTKILPNLKDLKYRKTIRFLPTLAYRRVRGDFFFFLMLLNVLSGMNQAGLGVCC